MEQVELCTVAIRILRPCPLFKTNWSPQIDSRPSPVKDITVFWANNFEALQGRKLAMRYSRTCYIMIAALLSLLQFESANAQGIPFYHEAMPPGAIGQLQLMQGRPMAWYYQPVEIVAPQGTLVSFVENGQFGADRPAPTKAGCLIGQVYRMRLSQIPLRLGRELYPSVEVIDRLHPPAGKETRFPIPIHITIEEINFALNGKFVTRVIYLENPKTALPRQQNPDFQPYFEVEPGQDPIQTADNLGRPIAILRIGSRRPTLSDPAGEFIYQSPPIQLYDQKTDLRPLAQQHNQATKMPLYPRIPEAGQPQVIPQGPTAYIPPNMARRPIYAPQPGFLQRR